MSKELDKSLDFVAEIFEPFMVIIANEKVKASWSKNRMELVKTIIEECREEVKEVINAFDEMEGKTIEYNGVSLSIRLLSLIGQYKDDFAPFFGSAGDLTAEGTSGSATVSTEASEH